MVANQSAQGLASLGRNGDSMLVHMSPREVAGLQGLAMAHGGSLTVNPETGLPEASFLGGILDFALPVVGGFFGMDPFLVAGLMGGKKLVETGDIGQAALAGFGSYGGAKLGVGLKDFTTPPTIPTAEMVSPEKAISNIENLNTKNLIGVNQTAPISVDTTPFNKIGAANAQIDLQKSGFGLPKVAEAPNFSSPATMSGYPLDLRSPVQAYGTTPTTGINLTPDASQFKPTGVDIPGATTAQSNVDKFTSALGEAAKDPMGYAKQVGGGSAGMGALKIGMYGASPFMEDILNPPAMEITKSEAEKYDPNRRLYLGADTGLRLLPNLNRPITGAHGGEVKAYALGGTVTTGGLRDLYSSTDMQSNPALSRDGYGIGRLDSLARQQSMNQAQTMGYDEGGSVSGDAAAGSDAASGSDATPASEADASDPYMYMSDIQRSLMGASPVHYTGASGTPAFSPAGYGSDLTGTMLSVSPEALRYSYGIGRGTSPYAGSMYYGLRREMGTPGYARGGYLDGQGDGMSDSIPATIEGKQPARLADGEFVVPADVVSHLGNGSSKAGSKRLYAMLDKVRQARTGNKKQGRQINADKYLPKVA